MTEAQIELEAQHTYETLGACYPATAYWPSWKEAQSDPETYNAWRRFVQVYKAPREYSPAEEYLVSRRIMLDSGLPQKASKLNFPSHPLQIELSSPDPSGKEFDTFFKHLLKFLTDWTWTLDKDDDKQHWTLTLLEPRKA